MIEEGKTYHLKINKGDDVLTSRVQVLEFDFPLLKITKNNRVIIYNINTPTFVSLELTPDADADSRDILVAGPARVI